MDPYVNVNSSPLCKQIQTSNRTIADGCSQLNHHVEEIMKLRGILLMAGDTNVGIGHARRMSELLYVDISIGDY